MFVERENVFYYITMTNENYVHPPLVAGSETGIVKGMYRFSEGHGDGARRVRLMGSGTILREAIEAAAMLQTDPRNPVLFVFGSIRSCG